jgi:hypothetical protein
MSALSLLLRVQKCGRNVAACANIATEVAGPWGIPNHQHEPLGRAPVDDPSRDFWVILVDHPVTDFEHCQFSLKNGGGT